LHDSIRIECVRCARLKSISDRIMAHSVDCTSTHWMRTFSMLRIRIMRIVSMRSSCRNEIWPSVVNLYSDQSNEPNSRNVALTFLFFGNFACLLRCIMSFYCLGFLEIIFIKLKLQFYSTSNNENIYFRKNVRRKIIFS